MATDRETALRQLRAAVVVKGRNPAYHDAQIERLRREWPALWAAVQAVLDSPISRREEK